MRTKPVQNTDTQLLVFLQTAGICNNVFYLQFSQKILSKYIRPKKISLLSRNHLGEKFFYHSPARIVKCLSEYIFNSKKQTNKQKETEDKKNKRK